jgi:hypothetical protein
MRREKMYIVLGYTEQGLSSCLSAGNVVIWFSNPPLE